MCKQFPSCYLLLFLFIRRNIAFFVFCFLIKCMYWRCHTNTNKSKTLSLFNFGQKISLIFLCILHTTSSIVQTKGEPVPLLPALFRLVLTTSATLAPGMSTNYGLSTSWFSSKSPSSCYFVNFFASFSHVSLQWQPFLKEAVLDSKEWWLHVVYV